jgi:tetratricopeptide (TPR) repeat protein
MRRSSLVLCLLAGGAVLAAVSSAHAQNPRNDDARTCATQGGPAAIEACTRAIAARGFSQRDLALLHYRRAVLLREANELDRAIADVTIAIRLNGDAIPTSADAFDLLIVQRNAYALRGGVFADKRDYVRALADYEALLAADPRDIAALLARAAILAQQGERERAIADYRAALAAGVPDAIKPQVLADLEKLGAAP